MSQKSAFLRIKNAHCADFYMRIGDAGQAMILLSSGIIMQINATARVARKF